MAFFDKKKSKLADKARKGIISLLSPDADTKFNDIDVDATMTPLERQLGKHYQEATDAKDSERVNDRFEENQAYWSGRAADRMEDHDETEDWIEHSTNICFPLVEAQTALALEKNIAAKCKGVEPSDQAAASAAENIIDFIMRANKMIRKLDRFIRNLGTYGNSVWYMFYDEEWQRGFGMPSLKRINPMFFYMDPSIIDSDDVQDAEYTFFVQPKTVFWAEKTFGKEKAARLWKQASGTDDGENDFTLDKADPSDATASASYIHMHYFTREYIEIDGKIKGVLRYIQASSDGHILYDSVDDENINQEEGFYPWTDRYPFILTNQYPDDGTAWGLSSIDFIKPIQNLIDELDKQIIAAARLTGNPQRLVNPALFKDDPTNWTNESGLIIPVDDVVACYRDIKPPDMPQYVIQRRNQAFEVERPVVSGYSDQMSGHKQSGVDTATEALALSQGGMITVDRTKAIIEEGLSEAFSYLLNMAISFWDGDRWFRLEKDGKDVFIQYNVADLGKLPQVDTPDAEYIGKYMKKAKEAGRKDVKIPSYMAKRRSVDVVGDIKKGEASTQSAIFDIQITIGAGMPQSKPFIYNAVMDMFKIRLISNPEARKMMIDMLNIPVNEEDPMMEIANIMEKLQENPEMAQQVVAQMQQGQATEGAASATTASGSAQNANVVGVAGQQASPERVSGVIGGTK